MTKDLWDIFLHQSRLKQAEHSPLGSVCFEDVFERNKTSRNLTRHSMRQPIFLVFKLCNLEIKSNMANIVSKTVSARVENPAKEPLQFYPCSFLLPPPQTTSLTASPNGGRSADPAEWQEVARGKPKGPAVLRFWRDVARMFSQPQENDIYDVKYKVKKKTRWFNKTSCDMFLFRSPLFLRSKGPCLRGVFAFSKKCSTGVANPTLIEFIQSSCVCGKASVAGTPINMQHCSKEFPWCLLSLTSLLTNANKTHALKNHWILFWKQQPTHPPTHQQTNQHNKTN